MNRAAKIRYLKSREQSHLKTIPTTSIKVILPTKVNGKEMLTDGHGNYYEKDHVFDKEDTVIRIQVIE